MLIFPLVMLRRWLREGKIKGIRPENRKEGWLIDHDDLERFIERRHLTEERLVAKLQDLISFLDELSNQRNKSEDRLERGIGWGYKQAKEIIARQFAFLLPKSIGGSEVGGLRCNPNTEFNLMEALNTWGDTLVKVLVQALEIRWGQKIEGLSI